LYTHISKAHADPSRLLLYVVYLTNDMHLNYIHLHIITGHTHV